MILGMDLGSNTLRVAQMNENLELVKEAEFSIGAARNLAKSGEISKEAIALLKKALYELKEKDFSFDNVRAVATAAFRKAKNTKEIFTELSKEFGINFKLIDAKTEAKLSVLGMKYRLKKLGIFSSSYAYCDLGGASCELSFKNESKSFDFGIISFYEKSLRYSSKNYHKLTLKKDLKIKDKKFMLYTRIKNQNLRSMAVLAFKESLEAKSFLKKYACKKIVLNSGVPTAILALKQGLSYDNYKANLINGKKLYRKDFLHFAFKIYNMSEKEASLFLGKRRKNYVVAGCFLLYALFDKEELIVVDEGIREGLCIDFYSKNALNIIS